MRTALAVVALVVSFGFVGQVISVINFRLAQRVGLQCGDETADPLFNRLELNTARWDILVMWTLPVAAVLMLLDHAWWPHAALVAGAVYVDGGGREIAKGLGLRAHRVAMGNASEMRLFFGYLTLMIFVGLSLIVYSLAFLL